MATAGYTNINEYIAIFPKDVQDVLEQVRSTIKQHVPAAEEGISYGIPTIKHKGKSVVFFAAYKNHISVYPAPRTHTDFKEELAAFKGGKGTVQFPLTMPMPFDLIIRIVQFLFNKSTNKTA